MSNSNSKMIVFASILGAILATGLLALNPSSPILTNASGQPYGDHHGYDNNYQKKSSHTNIQKIKCVNSNINVNGIDITHQIPTDDLATAETGNEDGGAGTANIQNGNGLGDKINLEKNLVNFCINDNDNTQERQPQSQSDGITASNLYIVEGPVATAQGAANLLTESIASCDDGDFVISGGFNFLPTGLNLNSFLFVKSIPTPTLDGWSASFQTGLTNAQIQATAVCFDAS